MESEPLITDQELLHIFAGTWASAPKGSQSQSCGQRWSNMGKNRPQTVGHSTFRCCCLGIPEKPRTHALQSAYNIQDKTYHPDDADKTYYGVP